MKPRIMLLPLTLFFGICFTGSLMADPYQIQTALGLAKSEASSPNRRIQETDVQAISLIYHLQPVATSNAPVQEQAFVAKSSFLAGSVTRNKPNTGSDIDVLSVRSTFVNQNDLLFSFRFAVVESEFDDSNTVGVSLGKYLDNTTTAVFSYEHADDGNVKKLEGRYRRLINGSSQDTFLSYQLGLGLTDERTGTGYNLSAIGSYYFPNNLALRGELQYLDNGESDRSILTARANYFFTNALFISADYSIFNESDDADHAYYGLSIGARI